MINNAMIMNKKASKISKFFILQIVFFSFKFVVTVFVSLLHDVAAASITLSQVITKSSIILAKYLLFSQLHVAGVQI